MPNMEVFVEWLDNLPEDAVAAMAAYYPGEGWKWVDEVDLVEDPSFTIVVKYTPAEVKAGLKARGLV